MDVHAETYLHVKKVRLPIAICVDVNEQEQFEVGISDLDPSLLKNEAQQT